jgi:hypothetical protein
MAALAATDQGERRLRALPAHISTNLRMRHGSLQTRQLGQRPQQQGQTTFQLRPLSWRSLRSFIPSQAELTASVLHDAAMKLDLIGRTWVLRTAIVLLIALLLWLTGIAP